MREIRASSLLYMAIVANGAGLFTEARGYLRAAAGADRRHLMRTRWWRVARRALLELRPRRG
jgi:hypothetical protein